MDIRSVFKALVEANGGSLAEFCRRVGIENANNVKEQLRQFGKLSKTNADKISAYFGADYSFLEGYRCTINTHTKVKN